jgi:tetratricopeptide (TPR) repeat protein
MARAERVGLGSLGIGLLIVLSNGLRPAGSQARGREPIASSVATQGKGPVAGPSVEADIAEFNGLLGRLRGNDESVVPAMRELAERLCNVHDRCDGKDILTFYVGMSPEDRARGLEEQARYDEIMTKRPTPWNEGQNDEDWTILRGPVVEQFRAIAERSLRQPDVFPGASALSSCAVIETDRLRSDYSLDEEGRRELLASAREDALASLSGFQKCGMLTPRLQPMWLLGYLHMVAGESVLARRAFRDCLALARRLRRPDRQEMAFQGLIDLAKEAGDYPELHLLLDQLASFRTLAESWLLVREQALLLENEDLAESSSQFLLGHRPSTPSDLGQWHVLLGGALLRQGNLNGAREQYALAQPLPLSRVVTLGMASVDLRAGNAERVLEQLSKPEFRKDIYPYEETLALQLCGDAALRLGQSGEAIRNLDRALRISGQMQARLAIQRDSIGAATSVLGGPVGLNTLALLAEARGRIGDHLEAARAIESWQSWSLRKANGANVEISTENLLSWAHSMDLGLVTWVVGADSTVVAHVAPDGSSEAVPIHHGLRAIEAAVRRLNEAIRGSDGVLAERLASQIGAEILPQRIAARIASLGGSGRKRVLFLVHGPLERLPLEFLCRNERVVPLVLPGLPDGEPGAPVAPRDLANWNVLGSPVDSAGRSLLPGASEELVAIAALHKTTSVESIPSGKTVQAGDTEVPGVRLRVGSAFDRQSLAAALQSRAPMHIATHLRHGCGGAEGRLADVGLELSGDDVFCAGEILESRPQLPLAVLAACETAEGRFLDAQGLQGLARAFLESGTRNLLVTLWPVEDQAARRFAEEFHRALIAGERPSEAATSARAALRSAGLPAADWAAFRLIGRD